MTENLFKVSPYNYAINNPIKYIDNNGEAILLIIGGVVLTATDVFLLSSGLVASGIIIKAGHDGVFTFKTASLNRDNEAIRRHNEKKQREAAAWAKQQLIEIMNSPIHNNNGGGGGKYPPGSGPMGFAMGSLELYYTLKSVLQDKNALVDKQLDEVNDKLKDNGDLSPAQYKELNLKNEELQNKKSKIVSAIGAVDRIIENNSEGMSMNTTRRDVTNIKFTGESDYEKGYNLTKKWGTEED